jgi:hypothetical protein
VFIRKLLAKPLQESEAAPENLRTIDQRVRRDADPDFPPRNQTYSTDIKIALAALKQFASQPAQKWERSIMYICFIYLRGSPPTSTERMLASAPRQNTENCRFIL